MHTGTNLSWTRDLSFAERRLCVRMGDNRRKEGREGREGGKRDFKKGED
jgi:hypothetical protein